MRTSAIRPMNGDAIQMECSDETIKIWPTQVAPAGYFDVGSPYIGRSSRSIVRKTSDLGAEAAKFSALNSLKILENLTIFHRNQAPVIS